MMMHQFCILLVIQYFLHKVNCVEYTDISSDVFGVRNGILAAFGDFNSDKLTDVFCITENGKSFEVLLAFSSAPYLRKSDINCTIGAGTITSIMPADYNGDSMMDILITIQEDKSKSKVVIFWGDYNNIDCKSNTSLSSSIRGQPLVLDYNGDMVSDLFGEIEENHRCIWIAHKNKSFTQVNFPPSGTVDETSAIPNQPLRMPHSSAFLDLNNDMVADVFITGESKMEYWFNIENNFIFNASIPYPNYQLHGQSTFVDIDCDGKLEHIMPVCNHSKNGNCDVRSDICIWDAQNKSWQVLHKFDTQLWGFKFSDSSDLLEYASLSVTLRAGDIDMDGFPDLLAVLEDKKKKDQGSKIVLLHNEACSECFLQRKFVVLGNIPAVSSTRDAEIATFYDIYQDGNLDILVSSKSEKNWKLYALLNTFSYDACFINVLVLNGLCYYDCPNHHIPYGTNQPGPFITYITTKPNGAQQTGCAAQMPQSAYFPLHLPYSLLGLGQTPNFVDRLTVTVPGMLRNQARQHTWTQIIPNSQMVVIPYPLDKPNKWINKLFVTPSHLVLRTFFALIGTCIFIAIIIVALHWKEKREDKREKLQEAHRFHFDAM